MSKKIDQCKNMDAAIDIRDNYGAWRSKERKQMQIEKRIGIED